MASVKVKNINVLQGATFQLTIPAHLPSGALYPLTAFGARMQIRPTVDSGTLLFDGDTATSNVSIDETTSEVTITIPAAISDAWDFTALGIDYAVYDVEVYLGSFVARLLKGNVLLDPNVTRA